MSQSEPVAAVIDRPVRGCSRYTHNNKAIGGPGAANLLLHLLTSMITQLDRCAHITGFLCALTLPIMVAATFVIVLLRYGFGIGSIALQEAILYLHSWIFLAGMSYCMKADAHVRVDILYRNFSSRGKAWVNALGGLTLLLPMCVVLLLTSWEFASRSWAIREVSAEAGGLPLVYWLKTLLPLGSALLLLQCLSEVLANTFVLVQRPVKRTPAS